MSEKTQRTVVNTNTIIGQCSNRMVTKGELIDLINQAFPCENGHIATITTIIQDSYESENRERHYIQNVIFSGILDADIDFKMSI